MMFGMAQSQIATAKNAPSNELPADLIDTLNFLIQGLDAMNTGLRATYLKLEEIERLIKKHG
jgi:hypothetical protein